MKLGELIEEIRKMDMMKYRRTVIPKKTVLRVGTEDIPVEGTCIFVNEEISLEQVLMALGATNILNCGYAAITSVDDQNMYVTHKGGRKVRYQGESYGTLEELVKQTNNPINEVAVKEINLSFNTGSHALIFE